MPPVDELNDAANPSPRPVRRAPQDDAPQPSVGKVILWIGLGCFTFVGLMGIIIVVGVWAVWTSVNDYTTEPDFSESVTFRPGDPLPGPPLELPTPSPSAAWLGDIDLTKVAASDLASAAYKRYQQGDFKTAIQLQYQLVIKAETGHYNLACYYARDGQTEAALYWLQVSAKEEGANAPWASKDADLIAVRQDPRWPKLLNYLAAYQWFWEQSGHSETSLVLPQNAIAGQPLPVFIGLHGLGSNAQDFVDPGMYQPFADKMGVAFLGVSGTLSRGKQSFVWTEDPAQDLTRIDAALQEVAGQLTPAEGKLVLFGFSQGGLIAGELAARHPERFAGAILLSPGAVSDISAVRLQGRPENRRQAIVAVCGAGEQLSTVTHTNQYAAAFKSFGARVSLKVYPGMNSHTFPPDFVQQFPIWGNFILNPDAPVPAGGQ